MAAEAGYLIGNDAAIDLFPGNRIGLTVHYAIPRVCVFYMLLLRWTSRFHGG
jgi:hypothetical protein